MEAKINIAVLASGSGSNLQSLIDNIDRGLLDARIRVVISNKGGAYALERAKKNGIPTVVIEHTSFGAREDFDRAIIAALQANSPVDLVVLAGFMRVLSDVFLDAFPLRVMNIHPALLPAFPGIHVQRKAVAYGAKFSGCTVHFVDKGVDTGPIIIQGIVPVYDDDTEDTLAARILKEEHRIYPQAIQLYAEGKLDIVDRRVRIRDGNKAEIPPLHNPPLTVF
jgi:phosphoribosylglycinamide formyltransferase-1